MKIKRGYEMKRGKRPRGSGAITRKDLIRGYKAGIKPEPVDWYYEKDKKPYKVYVS